MGARAEGACAAGGGQRRGVLVVFFFFATLGGSGGKTGGDLVACCRVVACLAPRSGTREALSLTRRRIRNRCAKRAAHDRTLQQQNAANTANTKRTTNKQTGTTTTQVVVAGLTNTYASYVTTPEEYSVQRYEGGFTLYGPHTLAAYLQTLTDLAKEMASGAPAAKSLPPGAPRPPDLSASQLSLAGAPGADGVPGGAAFGDVAADAAGAYGPGEVVEVSFR